MSASAIPFSGSFSSLETSSDLLPDSSNPKPRRDDSQIQLLKQAHELIHADISKIRSHAESVRSAVQKLDWEYSLLKNTSQIHEIHFQQVQDRESALSKHCGAQQEELDRLRQSFHQLEIQNSERKREFDLILVELQKKEEQLEHLRNANAQLEKTLQEIRKKEEVEKSTLDALKELDRKNQELQKLRQELDPRRKIQEKEALILKRHEKRLQSYSAILSNKNEYMKQFSRRLAEEIQSAQTMHPLKDYLALTESELSKLERRFKKLPASSPEHSELEETLNQMIEQRDFLRSLIEASTRQLNEQAARILSMIEDGSLAGVPPLPPKP